MTPTNFFDGASFVFGAGLSVIGGIRFATLLKTSAVSAATLALPLLVCGGISAVTSLICFGIGLAVEHKQITAKVGFQLTLGVSLLAITASAIALACLGAAPITIILSVAILGLCSWMNIQGGMFLLQDDLDERYDDFKKRQIGANDDAESVYQEAAAQFQHAAKRHQDAQEEHRAALAEYVDKLRELKKRANNDDSSDSDE